MGYPLFFVLSALAVLFAAGVVLTRHPVRSAMSLVVTLFLLAVMFVFLDADFVAALQVVVYAGAILVVFLFVIMLLNLQHDQPETQTRRSTVVGVTATCLVALVLLYFFKEAAPTLPGPGMGAPVAPGFGSIEAVGLRLFTQYLFQFEITGVLMLASVIGAVVLAKRKVG
jgi:NADH-quinone oxidoreductase subunit J